MNVNINDYKLDVDFDKDSGLLYATLTVPSVPKARGLKTYDVNKVLEMLEKQGFNLTVKDCISKTHGFVATNRPSSTKGVWTFRLASKQSTEKVEVEKVEVEKVEVEKVEAEELSAAPPTKKKKTRKSRTKKPTTSDVLKEYAKKIKR